MSLWSTQKEAAISLVSTLVEDGPMSIPEVVQEITETGVSGKNALKAIYIASINGDVQVTGDWESGTVQEVA